MENFFFLGSNGKIIEDENLKIDLPYIVGDFEIKNFFKLKEIIVKSKFNYNEIKNLFFFKSGRWDIETFDGTLIRLPKKNIKKSLELVLDLKKEKDFKEIKNIDLRQFNQVIINE